MGGSNHPGAGESRVGRGPHRSWVWGPRPPLQQVRPLSSTHASHGPSRSKATRTRELRPWGPLAQPPGKQQVREGWRSLAGEDPMKPSAPCPGGRACTEFASGFAGGRPRVLPRQLWLSPTPSGFRRHLLRSSLTSGHRSLPASLLALCGQGPCLPWPPSLPRARQVPGASQKKRVICEGISFCSLGGCWETAWPAPRTHPEPQRQLAQFAQAMAERQTGGAAATPHVI